MPISPLLLKGLYSAGIITAGYGTPGLYNFSTPILIEPIKFLGLTVKDITASQGLNENAGAVTITLVEDTVNGDSFEEPERGSPATIQVSGFRFDGLVQDVTVDRSIDAYPIYSVMLQNPVSLLDGTQVIIDGYNGGVSGLPNIVNAFGYWENRLGFGGSLVNAGGMPWQQSTASIAVNLSGQIDFTDTGYVGVKPALEDIINNNGASQVYGKAIELKGHTYNVDLDSLHDALSIPEVYRVHGPSQSVMEMITGLCEDAGFDYLIKLTKAEGTGPHTISFNPIDRRTQPDLNRIQAYVEAQSGYVMRSSYGKEFRNETTSFCLVGGLVEQLQMIDYTSIIPYWGEDSDGNPIMGSGTGNAYTASLNATPIADIAGFLGMGYSYPCSVMEMRCALVDFDCWAAYLVRNRFATVAAPLGIASRVTGDESPLLPLMQDFFADDAYTASMFGSGVLTENVITKGNRLYEFVRSYAEEFYGRKFMVKLPFVNQIRLEPETNNVVYSDMPSSSAYLPEGSSPIGLNYLNELFFLDQQGKFTGFCRFDVQNGMDLTTVSPESSILQLASPTNKMFTKVTFDERIVYLTGLGLPAAIMTVPQPIYGKNTSALGDIVELALLLNCTTDHIVRTLNFSDDTFPLRLAPFVYTPDAVALPMRSTRDRYGPWFYAGATGKTSFEIDDNLVPWNFSGFDAMNDVAQSRVQSAVNSLQDYEKGFVLQPGLPSHSMGDVLISGAPIISNVSIRLGVDGYTTQYDMTTYTPRFGVFTRDKAERFQRIGQSLVETRRSLRQIAADQQTNFRTAFSNRYGQMERYSTSIYQQSPHSVLVGHQVNPSGNLFVSKVSVQKYNESVVNCKPNNTGVFQQTAVMGLDGLLRPFSTNPVSSGAANLPHYVFPDSSLPPGAITKDKIKPLQSGHDFQWYSQGGAYDRLNARRMSGQSYDNARLLGLKSPMNLVGWGYTVYGHPYPNSSGYNASGVSSGLPVTGAFPIQNYSNSFLANHLSRSDQWFAGPADLRIDPIRGVWTVPTVAFGQVTSSGGIPIAQSGEITLLGNHKLTVYDYFGVAIANGKKVCATYDPLANRYYVTASQC